MSSNSSNDLHESACCPSKLFFQLSAPTEKSHHFSWCSQLILRVIIECFFRADKVFYLPIFLLSEHILKPYKVPVAQHILRDNERSLASFKFPNFQDHLKMCFMLLLRGILSACLSPFFSPEENYTAKKLQLLQYALPPRKGVFSPRN